MNRILTSLARWAFTVLIVVVAVFVAIWLWRRYETDPWTRDGHVYADVARVAPDVTGLVTTVAIHDNMMVHKGQLLFVVDRPRYANALATTEADIASARATLEQARKVARRDRALGDLVAKETTEQDEAAVATAQAALGQANAARDTALLNLQRTEVRAPVNGMVTNFSLRPGDYLAAGTQALALVDQDSIRVEAYMEETKLRRIRIGDQARIHLMGDEHDMIGHVQSIAGGISDDQRSNSANLLPTVNPTFTWVRLAQRIPVRIHVDRMARGTRLIPGRTATVTILAAKDRP
jgi:RND family efflux transporter MFP subunit